MSGRALQEWNLLSTEEQEDYDPAIRPMAAVQDFHHACQQDNEMITNYIRQARAMLPACIR